MIKKLKEINRNKELDAGNEWKMKRVIADKPMKAAF